MLNTLRRVVQAVNGAQDLNEAMSIMVNRVAEAIGTESCSVFLVDHHAGGYRLAASVGFLESSEGTVVLKFDQGLVGLVAEREEPINVEHASAHPRYAYFPQTGEERYEAFMGVPIIHQRQVLGVLVVQQRDRRRFDEGEEAFLVTVSAQLSGKVAHAKAAGLLQSTAKRQDAELTLKGISGSPGAAIGQAVGVYVLADIEGVPDRKTDNPREELMRFRQALELTRGDLQALHDRFSKIVPASEQALFDVYLQMLSSASVTDEIERRILAGYWAPSAVSQVVKHHVCLFEGMEDVYLRERAADLKELGRRILTHLREEPREEIDYPDDTILVGQELTAASLADVPPGRLKAIVSAKGSTNAHVAILARAMGYPAIMGATGLPMNDVEGKTIIVDGYTGTVHLKPSKNLIREYERLVEEEQELYAGLSELKDKAAITPDGYQIPLLVNTGLMADIQPALQCGAEGVGLYRTELPFMVRDRFPTEEEQCTLYRKLLSAFAPAMVTIRTLDIGGDKPLPYFPVVESNPFLGWRGIRVTLDHPEIFLVQLRALLRASEQTHNLNILLPMVCQISEVKEAQSLLEQAYTELVEEGYPVSRPALGVMVEVPSLLYQLPQLCEMVDFLSIGSNDLTQYLLAVDRNNHNVQRYYDGLHPAVLACMNDIVQVAKAHEVPVSICGELAGDPAAAILLLGMGFDSMSMSAVSLPRIKWIIRNVEHKQAQKILEQALSKTTAQEVRDYMQSALETAGLGGLVRAGK